MLNVFMESGATSGIEVVVADREKMVEDAPASSEGVLCDAGELVNVNYAARDVTSDIPKADGSASEATEDP